MSRTYRKDQSSIRRKRSSSERGGEPALKRRFLNFKKQGPPVDGDFCAECGSLTDFESGFLTCSKCGWTEDVIETFEFMEGTAA